MPLIMGTAGHVDHGKTTLIKALTGIDCDRLAEEKKRGITMELGFAFMDLAPGQTLGVVDVPGHERFVKNMVAGAAGMDFVLMVIAADEGIMPQTREHLEICALLGIGAGVVALTKADTVDAAWLDMVLEDVRQFLAPTFLAQARIIPVSAHAGLGLGELKAELARLARELKPRRGSDLTRLPLDRVFTIKGHGTVVTGTLIAGSLALGQELCLYPSQKPAKARGLQVHGAPAQVAQAGQRLAVNLPGLEVADIPRGEVLAPPGALWPSLVWHLELTCLASSPRALRRRAQVHFHHGTREVMARLYFWDRDKLEPGQTAICQARFEAPMAAVHGDRCVIRAFSPLRAVAGGLVLSPLPGKIKANSPELALVAELATAQPERLVAIQLILAGAKGASFSKLLVATGLAKNALEKILQDFLAKGVAACFDKEARIFAWGQHLEGLAQDLSQRLAKFHENNPLKLGMGRAELLSAWEGKLPAKLGHYLLEKLIKAKVLVQEQDQLRLTGHELSLGQGQSDLRGQILAAYQAGGLTPPNYKEVLDKLGINPKQAAPVYKLLCDQGQISRVKEDMYFYTKSLEGLKQNVRAYFGANQDLGPSQFKELTGLSRKFLIPLLEYLDKEKLTVRVGDARRLRA